MALEIELPVGFESITIKQWSDYRNAKSDIERLCALTQKSKEEISQLKLVQLNELIQFFESMLSTNDAKFQPLITIGKNTYGFIPDLYSISTGEYVDLMQYVSDEGENILKIMQILYRPVIKQIGEKYLIAPYRTEELKFYEDDIASIKMEFYRGAMLFFSSLQNQLNESLQEYLMNQALMIQKNLVNEMQ
jgi:uncharacterized UPF0146 family protein